MIPVAFFLYFDYTMLEHYSLLPLGWIWQIKMMMGFLINPQGIHVPCMSTLLNNIPF